MEVDSRAIGIGDKITICAGPGAGTSGVVWTVGGEAALVDVDEGFSAVGGAPSTVACALCDLQKSGQEECGQAQHLVPSASSAGVMASSSTVAAAEVDESGSVQVAPCGRLPGCDASLAGSMRSLHGLRERAAKHGPEAAALLAQIEGALGTGGSRTSGKGKGASLAKLAPKKPTR